MHSSSPSKQRGATLPTIQLDHRQFSRIFGFGVLVVANIANVRRRTPVSRPMCTFCGVPPLNTSYSLKVDFHAIQKSGNQWRPGRETHSNTSLRWKMVGSYVTLARLVVNWPKNMHQYSPFR